MKLGLQGVTVIYASGDSGVSAAGGICIFDPTANITTVNENPGAFSPGFPASCPYVTAVGATQVMLTHQQFKISPPLIESYRSTMTKLRLQLQFQRKDFTLEVASVIIGLRQAIKNRHLQTTLQILHLLITT
jgi:subtilase family serine protease